MPEEGASFALIFSVEDPGGGPFEGVGVQIMGPDDGYVARASARDEKDTNRAFWARRNELALGCAFGAGRPLGELPPDGLRRAIHSRGIKTAFSATATRHEGKVEAMDWKDEPTCTVPHAEWAFDTTPVLGWGGGKGARQRATAGWLAALPVFEPHWQVLMAHGTSTGTFTWGDTVYEFKDAPTYAEKNWGGSFPSRWFWAQCNHFTAGVDDGTPASVTLAGATRGTPLTPNGTEDVAILGVHVGDAYYEVSPMLGSVAWEVEPWGRWHARGASADGRVVVQLDADTDAPGVPLRAPTADGGLVPFCRDTFDGNVRVTVHKDGVLVADLRSNACALEVGGGPWWSAWRSESDMAPANQALLRMDGDAVLAGSPWQPPGY